MIYTYQQCLSLYGSSYNINRQIAEKRLFKLEKGLYSDQPKATVLQIISVKYPNAVCTMESAFYYHGLTAVRPDKIQLMTERGAARIRDDRVSQRYENSDELYLGTEKLEREGTELQIYTKERLLLELIRNRRRLSEDLYREVLENYRRILHQLDLHGLQNMVVRLPKSGLIVKVLEEEVFDLRFDLMKEHDALKNESDASATDNFYQPRVTTVNLENAIETMDSFESFERYYEETRELLDENNRLADYLYQLLEHYGIRAEALSRDIKVSAGYLRKLMNGTEHNPTRDLLLTICVYIGATVDETQTLLKYAGQQALYARRRRDAMIWFALKKHYGLITLNEHLYDRNYPLLLKKE